MKRILTTLALGCAAVSANAGALDGSTYCRTVKSDGSFGQPVGERKHCVNFENDQLTDNANTFFGNPPETYAYKLEGKQVLINDGEKDVVAYIVGKGEISRPDGPSLQLQK